MKTFTPMLTAMLVVGSLLAPAAQAQDPAPPAASETRQRAPGVPLAPRPGDTRSRTGDGAREHADRPETARGERPAQPDRDPPMPRGVPSIIAP